jgi:hypothetical protein
VTRIGEVGKIAEGISMNIRASITDRWMMFRHLNNPQSCSLVCRISKRADGILVLECQSSDVEADYSIVSPFAQVDILLIGLLGLTADSHSTKTLQYTNYRANYAKIRNNSWIVQRECLIVGKRVVSSSRSVKEGRAYR